MRHLRATAFFFLLACATLALSIAASTQSSRSDGEPQVVRGERLDASAFGPAVIEGWDAVLERERRSAPAPTGTVPRPQSPPSWAPPVDRGGQSNATLGGSGTLPGIGQSFVGPHEGDPGANLIPPDTCGSVGLAHFVAIVNANLSVYDKSTGVRVLNSSLASFWNTGAFIGDPRIVFDPHSQRFVALCSDFTSRIYFAFSLTSDPTGAWFKTTILLSQGSDAGLWPDYPTLGVDQNGIYTSAYMVGGGMSIFAIDKTPLLQPTPSVGTVTAFRNLPYEGAMQPCVTYGTPAGEFIVSQTSNTALRLRRVNPPLTGPTLSNLGSVSIPNAPPPPNAPSMGTSDLLDSLDGRLINSVYRNGSVWTTHGVNIAGKAGVRWYQIDPPTLSTVQVGSVDDAVLYYIMPSISVNANDDVLLGFSGSSSTSFAGCYLTGHKNTDAAGQTAVPVLTKAGEGVYSNGNPSRWGDYSLTSVDPVDDLAMWTIQEYARAGNTWGTWITQGEYGGCQTWVNYCIGSVNSVGLGASIGATGSSSVAANDLTLTCSFLPLNKPGLFFYGPQQQQVNFYNGYLCVSGAFWRLPAITSDGSGNASWLLDITNPPNGAAQITPGSQWNFQYWYRDGQTPPTGVNLSDALQVDFCP